MSRILALVALMLVAPASAVAATDSVAYRTPTVGPVFAGETVLWGEETSNGAVRVMMGGRGRGPLLIHRVAPATARKTERGFAGTPAVFAASSERFAALVNTATVTFAESDSVTIATTNAVISGRFPGAVEVLSGSIPERGDHGCNGRPLYEHPEAVDVYGDRVALGQFSDECTADNGPWDDSVVVVANGARTTIPAGTQGFIRDVALAGRFVAWVREGPAADELVLHDLDAGATVLRFTSDDLGARRIAEVDVQEDGTIAFTYSNRHFQRLAWAAPGTPGARVLDRRPFFSGLALAAGRVLYERVVSERRFTGELILRSLGGGAGRRLAFFPERRRRVGDLDLDATRATWATHPVRRGYEVRPRGVGRIVVRSL